MLVKIVYRKGYPTLVIESTSRISKIELVASEEIKNKHHPLTLYPIYLRVKGEEDIRDQTIKTYTIRLKKNPFGRLTGYLDWYVLSRDTDFLDGITKFDETYLIFPFSIYSANFYTEYLQMQTDDDWSRSFIDNIMYMSFDDILDVFLKELIKKYESILYTYNSKKNLGVLKGKYRSSKAVDKYIFEGLVFTTNDIFKIADILTPEQFSDVMASVSYSFNDATAVIKTAKSTISIVIEDNRPICKLLIHTTLRNL